MVQFLLRLPLYTIMNWTSKIFLFTARLWFPFNMSIPEHAEVSRFAFDAIYIVLGKDREKQMQKTAVTEQRLRNQDNNWKHGTSFITTARRVLRFPNEEWGFHIRGISTNVRKTESCTVEKGWSSRFEVGSGSSNVSPKESLCYETLNRSSDGLFSTDWDPGAL